MFVTDLQRPALDDEDRAHLERVLRVRAGEYVSAADGQGGWRLTRWGDGASLETAGPPVFEPPARPPVTIGLALVKGDRFDWAVQKLTELGVDRIVPLTTARAVVRWDPDRAGRGVSRWRKVARAAAMQSRRVRLPVIEEVTRFADLVAGPAALAVPDGGPLSLERPTVLVGPEGGWAPEEIDCGLPGVSLGPEVLRSETAAVAAAALLGGLRAGVVGAGGAP